MSITQVPPECPNPDSEDKAKALEQIAAQREREEQAIQQRVDGAIKGLKELTPLEQYLDNLLGNPSETRGQTHYRNQD